MEHDVKKKIWKKKKNARAHTEREREREHLASPVLTALHKLMTLEGGSHTGLQNTRSHSPSDTVQAFRAQGPTHPVTQYWPSEHKVPLTQWHSTGLQNTRSHSPSDTVPPPKTLESTATQMWELETSHKMKSLHTCVTGGLSLRSTSCWNPYTS
jgi:hypothetical protein